jgi:hypothetical protein
LIPHPLYPPLRRREAVLLKGSAVTRGGEGGDENPSLISLYERETSIPVKKCVSEKVWVFLYRRLSPMGAETSRT